MQIPGGFESSVSNPRDCTRTQESWHFLSPSRHQAWVQTLIGRAKLQRRHRLLQRKT